VQDDDLCRILSEVGVERIRTLFLGYNRLSTLPPAIGKLGSLWLLDLQENQLTTLPPEICQLTALTELRLFSNRLTQLAPEFGRLTGLNWLSLVKNRLLRLPSEIGRLVKLAHFFVGSNKLSSLPPEIGQLRALETLSVAHNRLSILPAEVGQLAHLKLLDLHKNRLRTLPPNVGQLVELEWLDLRQNKLSTLPAEVGHLNALISVDDSEHLLLPKQRKRNGPVPPGKSKHYLVAKLPDGIEDAWLREFGEMHLVRPLFVVEPQTTFADAWEVFCCDVLNRHYKLGSIRRRKAPEGGIDLYCATEKVAYQCKSVMESTGKFSVSKAVASLKAALETRKKLPWVKYVICSNVDLTGAQEQKLQDVFPDVEFLTPSFWVPRCREQSRYLGGRFRRLQRM